MGFVKIFLLLSLAGGGYHFYGKYQKNQIADSITEEAASANGFTPLPDVSNTDSSNVLVIAAENCSSEEAQKS